MRKLLLLLCALLLGVAWTGCTDSDEKPAKPADASHTPSKTDGKSDS